MLKAIQTLLTLIEQAYPSQGRSRFYLNEDSRLTLTILHGLRWYSFHFSDEDEAKPPQQIASELIALMKERIVNEPPVIEGRQESAEKK